MSRASAATTAAAELPAPKVRRLPAWTRRNIAWRAIPETYFTVLARELSPAAYSLAGLMICLAGEEEFCDVLQSRLAKLLKMHTVTVGEALDELERAGAIAKRKVGARKVYDLLVDAWKNVKCRPRPKVEEMPAAEEAEATEPAADAPRKPLQSVSIARGKTREIAIPAAITCRAVRCANESAFPLDVEARIISGEQPGADTIELAIREKSAISQHVPDASKGVKVESPSQMTGCLDPQNAPSELNSLREMVNRALGAHLGFVTDEDLRAIGTALNGCPIDQYARRLHQRRGMFTGGKGTWGGALLIAQDCAKAFAAASTPPPAAAQPEPLPTVAAADEAAYEAHCDQLFEAWWNAQSPDEQAKLNEQHRDAVYKQFAGTRYWPKAQLAETIRRSIRVEALKTLAPAFDEFMRRPRAKGASV
ncbi:MAG: hypothetical protein IPK75_18200 [Acidobacteria bacterium]|nr:hypothetical protein [Acidobacteriota bacterium]